jgi:Fe-S-cluster containining protein
VAARSAIAADPELNSLDDRQTQRMRSVPVELNAGGFSEWLEKTRAGMESPLDADVSCGTCVACCSSGQFVHVGPDEADALAHIPSALIFDEPHGPGKLMGYDEQGRCPMLTDSGCSIYDHRPQTCRTYDCRIFEAAAVTADQPLIRERADRWRFDIADETEQALLDQVRARAASLSDMSALRRAVLAVRSMS